MKDKTGFFSHEKYSVIVIFIRFEDIGHGNSQCKQASAQDGSSKWERRVCTNHGKGCFFTGIVNVITAHKEQRKASGALFSRSGSKGDILV